MSVFVLLYWQTNVVENIAENYINRMLKDKGQVTYEALSGSLINSIELTNVRLNVEDAIQVSGSYIEVRYRLLPLIFKRIEVSKIFIDQLSIAVEEGQDPEPDPASTFDIDATLRKIQQSNFADSLLQALPNIQLKDVEIYTNEIIFRGSPITLADIQLKANGKAGNQNYKIQIEKLKGRWKEKNWQLKSLSFLLQGNRHHFTLNQFTMQTEHSHLKLSGYYQLKDSIFLNLNLTDAYIDFKDVYKITNDSMLQDGYVEGTWTLSGQPIHLANSLNLKGRWQDHRLHRFQLDAGYNRGAVTLDRLLIDSNDGRLRLSGQGRTDKGAAASANMHFSDLNLGAFSAQLPSTILNGSLFFNYDNLDIANTTGNGQLMMYHSSIDSIPIDSIQFALSANRGDWKIAERSFIKIADSCQFQIEGEMNKKNQFHFSVSTFKNNLAVLGRVLDINELSGIADSQLRLSGTMDALDVSGTIQMPWAKFDQVQAESISLKFFAQNILNQDERYGAAEFVIDSGYVGKFPITDVSFNAKVNGNRIFLRELQLKSQNNYVTTTAEFHYYEDRYTLNIPEFKAVYESYWLENEGTLSVVSDSNHIQIESFRLLGPGNAELEIAGNWLWQNNDLASYIYFRNIKIQTFEQFWSEKLDLKGIINGYAEIYQPLTNPQFEVNVNVDSVTYNKTYLGQLSNSYYYDNGKLTIEKFNLKQNEIDFNITGYIAGLVEEEDMFTLEWIKNATLNVDMDLKKLTLEQLSPLISKQFPIKGIVRSNMHIDGSIGRPFVHQDVFLRNIQYNQYKLDSLNLNTQYNSHYLVLNRLEAFVEGAPISAKGWFRYPFNIDDPDTNIADNEFKLYLQSSGDTLDFLSSLNVEVEYIHGPYTTELYIGGTLEKPTISKGNIQFENADMLLSLVKDPIENVQFDAQIRDSVLHINTFRGRSRKKKDFLEKSIAFLRSLIPWSSRDKNNGILEASGTINLSDLNRPKLNLKAKSNDVYIDYFLENTQLVISSDAIEIYGRDTVNVFAEAEIKEGNLVVDLAQMERNLYLSETSVETKKTYTTMDINVNIPGNFTITSSPLDLTNNFKINIMGNIQVLMEAGKDDPQITGHLEVVSGKFSAFNQNFTVKSGTIDLKNPQKINPDINLVAVKLLDQREFELIITGNLEDLDQDIRVIKNGQEENMSYLDKISLLTLGADLGDVTGKTDSTLLSVGEDVATTSLLTAVERGTEEYTGLDKVEIEANKSLLNLKKMRLNSGLSDVSISFGKYLTNDLYVEYRTQFGQNIPAPRLGWDAGNRIRLEYRLDQNWKFDSFYEKTVLGNNKVKVGINWEYTF
ncbi:MAG: hypothetical protein GF313_13375 [Caldithrix sp.]|nr:hypothetical protein [Caldithrix sp.]